jgi:hypothetical protein
MTDHPISLPPKELISKWDKSWHDIAIPTDPKTYAEYMLGQAAQWGADQELEACIVLLKADGYKCLARDLRAARRPKPPSLKKQALAALNQADEGLNESEWQQRSDTIRRALEALPND